MQRLIARPFRALFNCRRAFFSGGHDGHDAHHYDVKLDRETNWANYNHDKKFLSVYGFNELNPAEADLSNPFPHLQTGEFFSYPNLVFNDPHHHVEQTDPLYNEPHGYIFGDDPLQSRHFIELPLYVLIGAAHVLMFIFTLGMRNNIIKQPEEEIDDKATALHMIESELEGMKNQRKQLKARLAEYQDKLAI